MKIAWISLVPFSEDAGGGGTYSRGLAKLLVDDPGEVRYYSVLPKNKLYRRAKLALSSLLSMVLPVSAKVLYNFSVSTIIKLLWLAPDLLVLDHVETAYLAKFARRSRRVTVLHNVEWHLMALRARDSSGWKRRFLRREADALRRYELAALTWVDGGICISPADKRYFERRRTGTELIHLPPQFDYRCAAAAEACPNCTEAAGAGAEARPAGAPLRLGFVGNIEWWPNRSGLIWFMEQVFPRLRDDELHIFGRGGDTLGYAADTVIVHGFVPSAQDVWNGFDVLIVPVLAGSGVSVKAAEGLYNHKPIISTAIGLRGLNPSGGSRVAIAETPEDWIAAVEAWRNGVPPADGSDAARAREFCARNQKRQLAHAGWLARMGAETTPDGARAPPRGLTP